MKTSKILIAAKKKLAHDYAHTLHSAIGGNISKYICHAIESVGKVPKAECWRVQDMIQAQIYPYSTLEVWLHNNHYIAFSDMRFSDRMQITRHAWIDSMIAEFKAKGD